MLPGVRIGVSTTFGAFLCSSITGLSDSNFFRFEVFVMGCNGVDLMIVGASVFTDSTRNGTVLRTTSAKKNLKNKKIFYIQSTIKNVCSII